MCAPARRFVDPVAGVDPGSPRSRTATGIHPVIGLGDDQRRRHEDDLLGRRWIGRVAWARRVWRRTRPSGHASLSVNADGRDVHQFWLGSDVLQSIWRGYGGARCLTVIQ